MTTALSQPFLPNAMQQKLVLGTPNTHTLTNLDGFSEGVVLALHLPSQQLEPVVGKHA